MKRNILILVIPYFIFLNSCNDKNVSTNEDSTLTAIELSNQKESNTVINATTIDSSFYQDFVHCSLDSIGPIPGDSAKGIVSFMFFPRFMSTEEPGWFRQDSLWSIVRKWRIYYPLIAPVKNHDHSHNNIAFVEIEFKNETNSSHFEKWVKNLEFNSKSHCCVLKYKKASYFIFKQSGFLKYRQLYSEIDSCLASHMNTKRVSNP